MTGKLELRIVGLSIPADTNVLIGQCHFIKSISDLYETLAESGTSLKFGVAFSEASGKRLVRSEGNDVELQKLAESESLKMACGHTFIIYLKGGYPINVLNRIKQVSEVANVFAATANPLQVIIAETENGRGVLGVIDGQPPLGIESSEDRQWRSDLLKKIGYKI